ncbi:hypothetical protein [Paenibacillus gorillae]|uniref:hypothetical protein n=1 Tax=Paenibacillus gorillae TaxID=1243662 RepID=UPI0004B81878|nr:hypothetical protein [Paenibacillus gorillae]
MNYFTPFESEMRIVFDDVKQRISLFPKPFDAIGLNYLQKFDVFQTDSAKNYICYLLPYWMRDIAPISDEQARKLSVAGVFNMLYYFILDDAMDSVQKDNKQKLSIAQLFQLETHGLLLAFFPAESPFWEHMRQYVNEWAVSVAAENIEDYFQNDRLKVANKAAPVKFASTGALLLSGKPELISEVDTLISYTLVTLQMADDWADWKEDLEEGSYNCLISLAASTYLIGWSGTITEKQMQNAIYINDLLKAYSAQAKLNYSFLETSSVQWNYLSIFHSSICSNLESGAKRVEKNRSLLLSGGGLQLFLSK